MLTLIILTKSSRIQQVYNCDYSLKLVIVVVVLKFTIAIVAIWNQIDTLNIVLVLMKEARFMKCQPIELEIIK